MLTAEETRVARHVQKRVRPMRARERPMMETSGFGCAVGWNDALLAVFYISAAS